MRKIILYTALSIDGYIARTDGDIDWLHDPELEVAGEDYGYYKFYESIDTTLMGYETFKQLDEMDVPFPYQSKTNYVFSRSQRKDQLPFVQFVHGDILDFCRKLKNENGNDIWLVGGGQINGLLLRHGLIDQLRISMIPRILGSGIELFENGGIDTKFIFRASREFKSGIVQLIYDKK